MELADEVARKQSRQVTHRPHGLHQRNDDRAPSDVLGELERSVRVVEIGQHKTIGAQGESLFDLLGGTFVPGIKPQKETADGQHRADGRRVVPVIIGNEQRPAGLPFSLSEALEVHQYSVNAGAMGRLGESRIAADEREPEGRVVHFEAIMDPDH
ncbi:MAG: hypothetical protein V4820_03200 [Pseudomonadota bacterium]